MASVRKDIVNDVIAKLKTITSPRIGKVSEKPSDFARLARTAYPFVQVNVDSETKEDIAMEWRLSTLELAITVHLEGKSKTEKTEEQLSEIVEAIEEKLEADRKRDSKAQITEVLEVGEIEVSSYPTVSQTMRVGIQYTYSRGNT
jgi:hypothetical protein|tara:strand:- start:542 stop:976 length:435 start_codon:yes stop_codon:yes gene_type:complete